MLLPSWKTFFLLIVTTANKESPVLRGRDKMFPSVLVLGPSILACFAFHALHVALTCMMYQLRQ